MSIIVECSRHDCEERFVAGLDDGAWSGAPKSVSALVLEGTEFGDLLYVYLPEGWRVEYSGLDEVIHCPDHVVAEYPAGAK